MRLHPVHSVADIFRDPTVTNESVMNQANPDFDTWIGKSESSADILTTAPVTGMAATLGRQNLSFRAGDTLPPLWHWLYFLNPAPQSRLARDGHPEKGDFLPPVPLPRRMWAGGRFVFEQSLLVGEAITRISSIDSIDFKRGRSGQLAFVCVSHEIHSNRRGLCIREEHDIVYREQSAGAAPTPVPLPAPEQPDFTRTVVPDPVLLFRYSALTFNGHRIHYDRDYVTGIEGYPGLVVHGPLLATLLAELLGETFPDRTMEYFEFKALRPVFDLKPFKVCGVDPNQNNTARLWIQDHHDALCMEASAVLG